MAGREISGRARCDISLMRVDGPKVIIDRRWRGRRWGSRDNHRKRREAARTTEEEIEGREEEKEEEARWEEEGHHAVGATAIAVVAVVQCTRRLAVDVHRGCENRLNTR